MDLRELKESVSALSDEELFELLAKVRANRRQATEKGPAKRKAKPTQSVTKALNELTPEDIDQLLELLGDD